MAFIAQVRYSSESALLLNSHLTSYHGSGGFSPAIHRGPGLEVTSVHVRCGEGTVALGQVYHAIRTLYCRYHSTNDQHSSVDY
jgi:hypothetical protein